MVIRLVPPEGMNRRWYGDYFSQENMGPDYATNIQEIRTRDGVNNIIFSARIMKINRFKKTERFLVVTSPTSPP